MRESNWTIGWRTSRCQELAQAARVHRLRTQLDPTIPLQVEQAMDLFGMSLKKRRPLPPLLPLHLHLHAVTVLLLLRYMKGGLLQLTPKVLNHMSPVSLPQKITKSTTYPRKVTVTFFTLHLINRITTSSAQTSSTPCPAVMFGKVSPTIKDSIVTKALFILSPMLRPFQSHRM